MKPFLVVVGSDLRPAVEEYRHIGYLAQGDWYGRDLKELYKSKTWVKDVQASADPESKVCRFIRSLKKEIYK
jgi:hypothetical protein